jgi:cellulose synthase operon protein C
LPVCEVDGQRVAERLSEPDARFEVEELAPDRKLETELEALVERALAARGDSAILLYFSGYAQLSERGELELALDLRRASGAPLTRLAALVGRLEDAFVLLDLVHEPDEMDPMLSTTYVAAARDAIASKQTGIGLIVAARPSGRSTRVPSALTHLLLRALEGAAPSVEGRRAQAVTLNAAYEAMREDRELFHELPAAGFFRGRRPFAVLLPPNVVVSDEASRSEPPPRSSVRPSVRPSVGPPSEAPSSGTSAAEGDQLAERAEHEAAIEAYKRALFLLGSSKGPERAALYHRIGRSKRALGSDTEAVHNFDKALGLEPLHARAFREAAEILIAQRDFERLEKLRRRRFEAHPDSAGKIAELSAIAELWSEQAQDDKRAIVALEQWIALRPELEAFERLVAALDRSAKPAAAIEARKRLAELHTDPVRRAQVLTDAARIAASSHPNRSDAAELAQRALEADAGALAALEIAAQWLGKQRRFGELAGLYESVLERSCDAPVAWDLAKRVGLVRRDQLDDAAGAKRAFARALEHDPSDVELRYLLAELLQAERAHAAAADQMRLAARFAPRDPDAYRRALWLFEQLGEADAAWCAAVALDQLGEADINESLLADAHRPEGLPAVRATLEPADWEAGLLHPERDRELDELLGSIADAALELAARRHARHLPALDGSTRQDVERGTATIARSLVWTSRLLGIELPELHVVAQLPVEIASTPTREHKLIVPRALATGLELPELAFLYARQLWYHRPEHRVLIGYPSLAELAELLLATLAATGHESQAVDERVRALADELAELLAGDALDALTERVGPLQTRGLRRRLVDWTQALHTRAARAGLIACADLERAAEFVRRHPPAAGIEPEAQIDDLRAFSISSEHARVRERLGVALRG